MSALTDSLSFYDAYVSQQNDVHHQRIDDGRYGHNVVVENKWAADPIVFQYKGCIGCLLYYDFNTSEFYINILFKRDYTYIKTIYQFELLINFYEAKDSKEIYKYLDLICQS